MAEGAAKSSWLPVVAFVFQAAALLVAGTWWASQLEGQVALSRAELVARIDHLEQSDRQTALSIYTRAAAAGDWDTMEARLGMRDQRIANLQTLIDRLTKADDRLEARVDARFRRLEDGAIRQRSEKPEATSSAAAARR